MISRTAELIYWAGRYNERIASHSRLIDVSFHTYLSWTENKDAHAWLWQRLLTHIGDEQTFQNLNKSFSTNEVLNFMTFDQDNPNSIFSCLYKARENIRATRERLPAPLWENQNAFYLWMKNSSIEEPLKHTYTFFKILKEKVSLFFGIADSTMLRQKEWSFLQLGRFIERAENTIRIMQAILQNATELPNATKEMFINYKQMSAALRALDGMEAFRKFHADNLELASVLQFLTLNIYFPRSLFFSFNALKQYIAEIEAINPINMSNNISATPGLTVVSKFIHMLEANIAFLPPEHFSSPNISKFLTEMLSSCNNLAQEITNNFFSKES